MSGHNKVLLEKLGKLTPIVVSKRAGVKVSQYQGDYNDGFAVVDFTDEVQYGEKKVKIPGRALWACGILRHMKGLFYSHSYIPFMLVSEASSPVTLLIDYTTKATSDLMVAYQVRRVVKQAWQRFRVECPSLSVKFGRTAEGRLVACNMFDHTEMELRQNGKLLFGPEATPEQLKIGYETVYKLSLNFNPTPRIISPPKVPIVGNDVITFG